MKIPTTEIPNPLYNPKIPSDFQIYLQQSKRPLNYFLSLECPISAASLVLAKSREQTTVRPIAPATPPDIRFPTKNLSLSVFGLIFFIKIFWQLSLTPKLMAVVGKYLIQLARLPFQQAKTPSSFQILQKQFRIPVYYFPSIDFMVFWTQRRSLTLSIGAASVLAIAPVVPPITKSFKKAYMDH